MDKNLKTFIRDNRAAFDAANPPDGLWERIEASLDGQQPEKKNNVGRISIARITQLAAAVLVLAVAGALVFTYGRKQGYEDYHRINPQLAVEQQTYADLVTQKKDSIAFIAATNPTLYGEFSSVLEQMEASYLSLKQELPDSPNQQMTLEAMIHNLKIQIEVLGQQLDTYHYINTNIKNGEHEHQI